MHFSYLSHLFQPWILPPGINLLLAVIGYLIFQYSKPIGKCIITLACVSLWLFCTPLIAQLLINHLQNQYPVLYISQLSTQNSSAIIVLGGGHEVSVEYKDGYVLCDDTEDRLHYAAYLYHKTHFPIIVSGGAADKSTPSEAELMRKDLKNYFNITSVLKEDKSTDTKDEANLMVQILKDHHIKIAYLVTNAWHMPRAMYAFNYAFANTSIKIIAAPTGYIGFTPNQGIMHYLPAYKALDISATAMHEYVGILAYRLNNLLQRARL